MLDNFVIQQHHFILSEEEGLVSQVAFHAESITEFDWQNMAITEFEWRNVDE